MIVIVIVNVIETGTETEMRFTTVSTRFHLRSSHKCQEVVTDNPHNLHIISSDINKHLIISSILSSLGIHNMAAIIGLLTWLRVVRLALVTTIVMKTLRTATEEITCQSLCTSR